MASNGLTRKDLMDEYPFLHQDLDKEVAEEHLTELSRIIEDHEIVGHELRLTSKEITDINQEARTQELCRLKMLKKWKQKFAFKATYERLIDALLKCCRGDHAQDVSKLLSQSSCTSSQASASVDNSATLSQSLQGASYTDGAEQNMLSSFHADTYEEVKSKNSPVSQFMSIGAPIESANTILSDSQHGSSCTTEKHMNTEDTISVPKMAEGSNRRGKKVYIVLCVDVSPSMDATPLNESETHLKTSIKIATRVIRQKMFENIYVGLVLFGTSDTKSELAKKEAGYENITVAWKPSALSREFLQYLTTQIQPGCMPGNFLDAVVVAMDELVRATATVKNVAEKKIYLFTDARSECCKSGLKQICGQLKKKRVELEVFIPDVAATGGEGTKRGSSGEDRSGEEHGGNRSGGDLCTGKPPQQMAGETMLAKMVEEVNGTFLSFRKALQVTTFIEEHLRQTSRSAYINIGQKLKINCKIFTKTMVYRPDKRKSHFVYGKSAVKPTRSYYLRQNDKTTVKSTNLPKDYCGREGLVSTSDSSKQTVTASDEQAKTICNQQAVESSNQQAMKASNERTMNNPFKPCLLVLHFLPQDYICHHQIIGSSTQVVAHCPEDQNASKALSALVNALRETESLVVARYVVRKNSYPKPVALIPLITASHECLLMLQLPCKEDVRYCPLEPLPGPGENAAPNEEQLSAVDDLITSMDLMTADINDDGKECEALQPNLTHNPAVQHTLQCDFHHVLHPDDSPPDVDPNLSQLLQPKACIVDRSSGSLAKVQNLFPLDRNPDSKKRAAAPAVRRKISVLDLDSEVPPVKKSRVEGDVVDIS